MFYAFLEASPCHYFDYGICPLFHLTAHAHLFSVNTALTPSHRRDYTPITDAKSHLLLLFPTLRRLVYLLQ